MQLKILLAGPAALALLAGCQAETATVNEAANVAAADDVSAAPPPPDLLDTNNAAPSDAAAAQPCPEGAQCFGALVVQPGSLVLNRSGAELSVTGSISLRNRNNEPVMIAALDPAVITLDNGDRLQVRMYNRDEFSGLLSCESEKGPECYDRRQSEFRQITADDSVAHVSITFSGRVDDARQATLPDVQTGTVTMRFYVVPSSGQGRTIDVSLPDVALRNQIKG